MVKIDKLEELELNNNKEDSGIIRKIVLVGAVIGLTIEGMRILKYSGEGIAYTVMANATGAKVFEQFGFSKSEVIGVGLMLVGFILAPAIGTAIGSKIKSVSSKNDYE